MKRKENWAVIEHVDKFDWNPAAVQWMRSRPESIKQLMLRFPPNCLVKATRPLLCPANNKVGQVSSYMEPDDVDPEGSVTVYDPDEKMPVRHQCKPEWLEVVGYWKDMDPQLVKKILDED